MGESLEVGRWCGSMIRNKASVEGGAEEMGLV